MRLKTMFVPFFLVIILFGGILISKGLGLWVVESTKVPSTIQEGAYAGSYDPADIRGSYSFSDIEKNFQVPVPVLAEAFGIALALAPDFKCKDLEALYPASVDGVDEALEIGTGSVRRFVALYTGLPYDGEDALPETAKQILGDALVMDTVVVEKEIVIEQEIVEEHEQGLTINGKSTVTDVINLGLALDEIESILGFEVANPNMTVRDLCTQNERSFSEVKTALSALLVSE